MVSGIAPSFANDSPALRTARRVRSQFRFAFEGKDDGVVRIPPGNVTRLVRQLADTVTRSVSQIVPLTAENAAESSYLDTLWRSLAQDEDTGVIVHRLYLVPPGGTPPEPEHPEGRFQVRKVAVREFIETELAALPVRNLWLLDDSVVISEEPDDVPHWQVSQRPDDVTRFKRLWEILWDSAAPGRSPSDPFAEPLAQSADMMATIAKMSCNKRMYVDGTCSWYHGNWQYLRLFNLVSSPAWHSAFYRNALYNVLHGWDITSPGKARPNVLISGAADYSTLAYVLNAAERAQAPVDVRVVDQCRTPLIACEWYGRLRGMRTRDEDHSHSRLRVLEMDIHTITSAEAFNVIKPPYQLITADAFLTRFERDEAAQIVKAWHQLLAPGGAVVTTVRVHPLDEPHSGVLDEVSNFAIRARNLAARWRPYVRVSLDEITTAARQYAIQMRSFDLGDVSEIRSMFAAAGFQIEPSEPIRVQGELHPSHYLQVVARKPSS